MSARLFLLVVPLASLCHAAQPESLAPEQALRNIQALVQRGDFAAAQTEVEKAIKNYPRDPVVYNFRGVVFAQQGKYREAESSFFKATEFAPAFRPALENLARLYQENTAVDDKAVEKGIATYQRLLKLEPALVDAHYQLAVLFLARSRFRESLAQLDHLPKDVQARPQAVAVRCASEVGLGNASKAQQLAQELLNTPDLNEADVDLALPALVSPAAQPVVLALLEGLARRGLASDRNLRQLATFYEGHEKFAEAREMYQKSAGSGKITPALLLDLARVAYKQSDFEGALSYLAHARDLDPRDPGIHFFFGMTCIELDLPLDAEKSLKSAVELSPQNPYYNYALGAVMANGRKWKEAIPYFQKYCSGKPEDPRGKLALASAHFHAFELELARKEFLELAGKPETSAGAHYHLGLMAAQENDFPAAVKEFDEAVRINPGYAEALAELGFAHMQLESYEQAHKALKRSLELNPDSRRANMVLLSLYQRTEDPKTEEQAKRFAEVDKKLAERAKMLLRAVEVRPYQ